MSHPLLWLLGFFALDKINRQSRAIKECSKRLEKLESGAPLDATADAETIARDQHGAQGGTSGCLGAFLLFFIAIPMCCLLLYGLVFTSAGHVVLAISGAILFLVLFVKRSPAAIGFLFICASVLMFSVHDIWAVLFFWLVSAVIVGLVLWFTGKRK